MKMYTVMITAALLLLSCHRGHTIECYSCDYGLCLAPSKDSCSFGQVCGTETAKDNTGFLNLKKKGCTSLSDCLSESSVSYLGITVTTTRSCCITSLCNSAATPKVSIVTGVAAIVAFLLTKLF
ncbi:PREDICTED: lymphocyte antigen 6 complex locus protein G6d-like isoform X2 [Nanorana parkeri]|uniref:lymphocyte antigen 6 complex locus protein G6d-like isoform X1 n=1 Tax=Nanorana parkeri TaxID=125878 RepID=UPI00085417EF|nr:PREDICTED: lymphocyte antigen 6 complex locus protein G6d-like isoform X1 [Nanorana parkeri]XP_018420287.1 PREDICTED: lymphocyte antigen 6 complex locus protein G6d-like isoform X2 [Nanorana parkeri]